MTGPAGAVHPPPKRKTPEEERDEFFERAKAGAHAAGHRVLKERPADPYVTVHPDLDKLMLWWPPAAITYFAHKARPDSEKLRYARFRMNHPFRTHTGRNIGRRSYREDTYTSIWGLIKNKADEGVRIRMGGSDSKVKLWPLWYVYNAWLTFKFISLGSWWYMGNAALRRFGFNVGVGVKRTNIPLGRWLGRDRKIAFPYRTRLKEAHAYGHRKAGIDGAKHFAAMFYSEESQVPRKPYGVRARVRQVLNSPHTIVHKFIEDEPAGDRRGAADPGVDPHEAPTASHEAATATHEAPTAEPRIPPAAWKHLTPKMREAIGREIEAYREARRESPDAQQEFVKARPEFTDAYTRVLKGVRDLDASKGPGGARKLVEDILTTERIDGHIQNTLLSTDARALELLNSLYQIRTAPKGTTLEAMKKLAGATVDGKPTKAQMGITFPQVRTAVAAQMRNGGLAL
jgi:hypothetical protein